MCTHTGSNETSNNIRYILVYDYNIILWWKYNTTAVVRNTYNVPSEKDGSLNYVIRLINETCICKLSCVNCNACVRMYTSSCMDATLHVTVCKHAHVKDVELSKLQLTVQCKRDELNVLVAKCEQADALKTASQHVTSAIMAIRAIG